LADPSFSNAAESKKTIPSSVRWKTSPVAANVLINDRHVQVGKINSAQVDVTLEDFGDPESLGYLRDRPRSALVVSIFIESDVEKGTIPEVQEGHLSREVCARLKKIAPDKSLVVEEEMRRQFASKREGDAIGIDLGLSTVERAAFPVDRLIFAILRRGRASDDEYLAALNSAIVAVIKDARQARMATLVMPVIGYKWTDKLAPSFDEIFEPFFSALEESGASVKVYFSLYGKWPTHVIENAVSALNRALVGEQPNARRPQRRDVAPRSFNKNP